MGHEARPLRLRAGQALRDWVRGQRLPSATAPERQNRAFRQPALKRWATFGRPVGPKQISPWRKSWVDKNKETSPLQGAALQRFVSGHAFRHAEKANIMTWASAPCRLPPSFPRVFGHACSTFVCPKSYSPLSETGDQVGPQQWDQCENNPLGSFTTIEGVNPPEALFQSYTLNAGWILGRSSRPHKTAIGAGTTGKNSITSSVPCSARILERAD
jgi:hypothetical protein